MYFDFAFGLRSQILTEGYFLKKLHSKSDRERQIYGFAYMKNLKNSDTNELFTKHKADSQS